MVDGSDANCVPYNPWVAGGVTPAQLAYLQVMGIQTGNTQQQIQGANIASDLGNYGLKMPMAKNGVGVSFGVERRMESLELVPDSAYQSGDLSGFGGPVPPQKGQYMVKDYFGEVRVPLLESRPLMMLTHVSESDGDDYVGITPSAAPRPDAFSHEAPVRSWLPQPAC